MATGCPVVASNVGGIPEAVSDGHTGILVAFESLGTPTFEPRDPVRFSRDLAQAINQLLDDDKLRKRMGQAGKQRVADFFSWKVIARETVSLYESLLPDI
jgi:glycosyltransferase involved in cell wall biosynthesis